MGHTWLGKMVFGQAFIWNEKCLFCFEQLTFLNQLNGKTDCRNDFMINLHKSDVHVYGWPGIHTWGPWICSQMHFQLHYWSQYRAGLHRSFIRLIPGLSGSSACVLNPFLFKILYIAHFWHAYIAPDKALFPT